MRSKAMTKAKVQLLIKHPFYGCLLMGLEDTAAPAGHPVWEKAPTPTLATDGKRLYYDPAFVEGLSLDELMGVLCHEVLHCAFAHLSRRGHRDIQRWGIATDIAVNNAVLADSLTLPAGGLVCEAMKGMPSEGIYNKIKIVKVPQPKGSGSGGGCAQCQSQGQSQGKGQGQSSGKAKGQAQGSGHIQADVDGHAVGGHQIDHHAPWEGSDGGEDGKATYSELDWKDKVATAVAQAKSAGKFPGHLESLFEELLHPTLDWKQLLAAFVQSAARSSYKMNPPNKRFLYYPMYLPTVSGESLEVVVGVDTSGSVSDPELQRFLSELVGITQQFDDWEIHVIQCDARVHQYDRLTPYEGDVPHKGKGRGGTDFHPVLREIEKRQIKAPVMVWMTDGMPNNGYPKQPDFPVLWVLTPRHEDPPWGEKVVLDEMEEAE